MTISVAALAGMNGQLKYAVGGQSGTPTYADVTSARDVKLNLAMGEGDASTRGGGGFKATIATLMDVSLDFQIVADESTPHLDLVAAFKNRSMVAFKIIDKTNGDQFLADFEIFKMEKSQPLDNVITLDFTAKPCYSATAPSFTAATA